MKRTTTYLHFNGNCRTAMAFYRECFGGELEVMAYPDASGKPNTDPKAPVQHSTIAQGGQALLMASDYPPGSGTSGQGNDFSVFMDGAPSQEGGTMAFPLSDGARDIAGMIAGRVQGARTRRNQPDAFIRCSMRTASGRWRCELSGSTSCGRRPVRSGIRNALQLKGYTTPRGIGLRFAGIWVFECEQSPASAGFFR
jgi:PhnB protein